MHDSHFPGSLNFIAGDLSHRMMSRARVAIGTIRRMESFEREIGSRTSTLSQATAPGVRLHPFLLPNAAGRQPEPRYDHLQRSTP